MDLPSLLGDAVRTVDQRLRRQGRSVLDILDGIVSPAERTMLLIIGSSPMMPSPVGTRNVNCLRVEEDELSFLANLTTITDDFLERPVDILRALVDQSDNAMNMYLRGLIFLDDEEQRVAGKILPDAEGYKVAARNGRPLHAMLNIASEAKGDGAAC